MSMKINIRETEEGFWNFFVVANNGITIAASVQEDSTLQNYHNFEECEEMAAGLVSAIIRGGDVKVYDKAGVLTTTYDMKLSLTTIKGNVLQH